MLSYVGQQQSAHDHGHWQASASPNSPNNTLWVVQKYEGVRVGDGPPAVFTSLEDTGIPMLRCVSSSASLMAGLLEPLLKLECSSCSYMLRRPLLEGITARHTLEA